MDVSGTTYIVIVPYRAADPNNRGEIEFTYGLDIETDTTIDGLDPKRASIVSVAVATWQETHVIEGEEHSILSGLKSLLTALQPGILVTWNGSGFDLPFLHSRSALHELDLGLSIAAEDQRWMTDPQRAPEPRYLGAWSPHRHLDGYRVYRSDVGRALDVSCGLKPLSRMVGLNPVEVDRTKIHLLTPAEIRSYVGSDAELARELVLRRWSTARQWIDQI